jgi:hypothetical protein
MNRHNPSKPEIQDFSQLLDNWRPIIPPKPETRAGRYIISRFPVPPSHADLIAVLAGLGPNRRPI